METIVKWKYMISTLPDKEPVLLLSNAGEQGWELVTVVVFEGKQIAYFKRPIQEVKGETAKLIESLFKDTAMRPIK